MRRHSRARSARTSRNAGHPRGRQHRYLHGRRQRGRDLFEAHPDFGDSGGSLRGGASNFSAHIFVPTTSGPIKDDIFLGTTADFAVNEV